MHVSKRTRDSSGRFIRVALDYPTEFWKLVNKTDKCWLWEGTSVKGYGYFFEGKKRVYAHRYSWFLKHRTYSKLDICHKCDNPPCVNPDHLFEGTEKDNIQDALKKGRFNKPGRRLPQYKLSKELADEIRSKYKPKVMRYRDLAEMYGVSYGAIRQIMNNEVYV